MRIVFGLVGIALLGGAFWLGWQFHGSKYPSAPGEGSAALSTLPIEGTATGSAGASTDVYAHNLMLRKGPNFRVYVRWLRGKLVRTSKNENPSFDDPDSFFLAIHDGILRANVGDLANYLNNGGLGNSPLKNVTLSGDGAVMNIKGTIHKGMGIALPIQVTGELSVVSDNQIRLHVLKIDVLKIPFQWLFSRLHVSVEDLAGASKIPGLEIVQNDILFDTKTLLPPPHIQGQLTKVHIVNPDLEEVYGSAGADLARVEKWRNFLRLKGGSIDFGKLTMHDVDLTMIDVSSAAWFDLDLTHYQDQLVYGYTRMTAQAGLEIFMPDLSNIPQNANTKSIGLEWMKNRYTPVPASVTQH